MPGARRAVEADVHSSTRAATPVSAPRIERGDVPESTAAHEQAQAREPLRPPPGDQLHAHADTQTHAHVHAQLPARVEALEVLFRHIAATRMADVPICHPGLAVAAVGFEPQPAESAAVGVLLTPWFMNLVWLPMASAPLTAVGASRSRAVGQHSFDFIAHHEAGFGSYEACSLFSPMNDFEDQAAALATAQAVLDLLRAPVAEAPDALAAPDACGAPATEPVPARRRFLLGRGGA